MADEIRPAAPLQGEHACDVAIVGAGYAGLWTAYYLKRLDPAMDVAVVEAEFAGRGAAGRNGGWCSFDLANLPGLLRNQQTRSRALDVVAHMVAAVDTVGEVASTEGIQCDYHKGGVVHAAVSPPQLDRARRLQDFLMELDLGWLQQWLEPAAMARRVHMANNLGGVFSPHCAVLHPARLARGLAHSVVRHGVRLYEGSPVRAVAPGRVHTAGGRLTAGKMILASEGYTGSSPGLPRRRLLAMHSFMAVTQPLDERILEQIGLAEREAFGDYSWLVTYGQRTADNCLAFGYGGKSYYDGRPRDVFPARLSVFRAVRQNLQRLFPVLKHTTFQYLWGGAMAMSRDQTPFIHYDPDTATGWLGGFFGNGVAATNLGGRAMADLVLGRATALTDLSLLVKTTPRPLEQFPSWEWSPVAWAGTATTLKRLRRRDRQETGS